MRDARALHVRKHRSEQRCFLIEGPTAVAAALESGSVALERIFIDAESERAGAAAQDAQRAGLAVFAVDARTMRALSQTRSPQGVVAVARCVDRPIGELAGALDDRMSGALVVVLHDIADPGNAGTLVRSAEAFGANAVCWGVAGVDPYNEKVVRASMGSLFHIPLFAYDGWPAFAGAARAAGLAIVAAEAGAPDVRTVALPARSALVVGHERRGLAAAPAGQIDLRVGIPQSQRAESLNAAVAGSILMYEIARATGRLPQAAGRSPRADGTSRQ